MIDKVIAAIAAADFLTDDQRSRLMWALIRNGDMSPNVPECPGHVPDETKLRREYERRRKAEWRAKSKTSKGGAAANDPAQRPENVPDMSGTRPDSPSTFFLSSEDLLSEVAKKKKRTVVARASRPPKKATRLAEDWLPSAADKKFATDRGLDADAIADEFRDFWIGVPGSRGLKENWPATWRNRVREVLGKKHGKRTQPSRSDAITAGVASAVSAWDREHGGGDKTLHSGGPMFDLTPTSRS